MHMLSCFKNGTSHNRKESEYKLRQIIETVPGLLWSNDPDGELTHVNQRILDYTGKRLEDFKQRGWEEFQHPDDLPETAKAFYHAIQTGNSYQAVFRLRRADGEYRWYHARGEPLRDRDGRIVQWYGLSVDIDEGKKADERLRQLEADLAHMNRMSMMGELAASLSHEITQPIASARNNARAPQNFLDMQPPDLDEVREALSCVVGDTDHAGKIIDRICDHIKNAPPRKGPFDLKQGDQRGDRIGARRNHHEWSLGPKLALRRHRLPSKGIVFNCSKSSST
jgi:PAS domain S-box-containing protein